MVRARLAVTAFWRKAYEDNLTGLASMVAYNLLLSIFPLALVALFIASRVLSSPDIQASVLVDLQQIFPSAAESTLSEAVRRLQESSPTTGIVAIVAAVWIASSFWGALDTAFCQIYHRPCRSWVQQKLFAFGMFAVVLLFIVASVAVPALQSLLVTGANDLPFGLSEVRTLINGLTLAAGVLLRDLPARPERLDPVVLRVAGRTGGDGRDGHRRLLLPALPPERDDPASRHHVRLRPDRARLVLRAGDDPARGRGGERAALRAPARPVTCAAVAAIETAGLTKRYGPVMAVDDLSFAAPPASSATARWRPPCSSHPTAGG